MGGPHGPGGTCSTAPERAYVHPRISPDGMRVALSVADQDNDIWMWELARQTLTRLTFDPSFDSDPLWRPDGASRDLRVAAFGCGQPVFAGC